MHPDETAGGDGNPGLNADPDGSLDPICAHVNESQLRALSVRLSSINEHLKLLRKLGVSDPLLDSLQDGIFELARGTGATISAPMRPDPVGVLIHVLIKLDEIAPDAITAYGPLEPEARDYLTPVVNELYERASQLQQRLRSDLGTVAGPTRARRGLTAAIDDDGA